MYELLAALICLCGGAIGFTIAQDRRITRLEDRVASIGQQFTKLPKRKGDSTDG